MILRSILTTSDRSSSWSSARKESTTQKGTQDFTWKPLIEKNHKEKELYYNSQFTWIIGILKMSIDFSQNWVPIVSGIESLSLLEDEVYLCLTKLLAW